MGSFRFRRSIKIAPGIKINFNKKSTSLTLGRRGVHTTINKFVNVNIRMYNFDDVQCTVIPSVAYGFVTGMNLQLC